MRKLLPELKEAIEAACLEHPNYKTLLQMGSWRSIMANVASAFLDIKEATGKNDGYFVELIQKTVDGVSMQEPYCFPGHTEILTERGWQKFSSLEKRVRVAQVDDELRVSFDHPIEYIEKNYSGPGFKLSNRNMTVICDKGHRFFGDWNNLGRNEFKTLESLSTILKIPSVKSKQANNNSISDNDLMFIAAFVSDGVFNKTRQGKPRVRIQVSRTRKVEILSKLKHVGKTTAKRDYGISKIPQTCFTFEVPDYFEKIFSSYKCFNWDFVFSLSAEQCEKFIEYYSLFDGSVKKGSKIIFSSKKDLFDQLTTIAQLAGLMISCSSQISRLSGRPNYRFTFSKNKQTKTFRKKDLTKIELNETLYCVSVPKQRILIRDEKGNICVVGNCMAFVQSVIAYTEYALGIQSHLMTTESVVQFFESADKEKDVVQLYPRPGYVACWRHRGTRRGHAGIVYEVGDGWFTCIEGNSRSGSLEFGKSNEGEGIFLKRRTTKSIGTMDFLGYVAPFRD